MTDIEKRRGGFYYIDGNPYISATRPLKILNKPALRYWFGRKVYRAYAKNPELSESEALSAPYQMTKKSQNIGNDVHEIIAGRVKAGAWEKDYSNDVGGFITAYKKWEKENDIEYVDSEFEVVSKKHRVAGTVDLIIKLNGELFLVDIKTGKNIYPEVELQLSAYKQAYQEMKNKRPRLAVILLEKNDLGKASGEYHFKTVKYQIQEYLAAKKLWLWQNKDKAIDAGYL